MADQEAVQARFDDYKTAFESEEEGLDRKGAYNALCMLGYNPISHAVCQFFEERGKDCLCMEDFQELVNSMDTDPKAVLREALQTFAGDDDFIDKDELRRILMASRAQMDKKEDLDEEEDEVMNERVEEVFAQADLNGDGHLPVEELVEAICGGHVCID